jgi:hypothetical protein
MQDADDSFLGYFFHKYDPPQRASPMKAESMVWLSGKAECRMKEEQCHACSIIRRPFHDQYLSCLIFTIRESQVRNLEV